MKTTENFADQVIIKLFNDESLVNEMLDKFGLNWKVSKQPLLLPGEVPTGFFGIVRDDSQSVFTTCKDSYVPFQNQELGDLLLQISKQAGYEIHSGGQFNGGGKVYLQLETGNQIEGLGKNGTTVKGFVTGLNAHDGSSSLKWGAVNFTICCRNTFAHAQKTLGNSARHTASIHAKVEAAIRDINGVIAEEKSLFDQFIRLSNVPVKQSHIAKIVKQITDVDITLTPTAAKDKYSSYTVNRSTELMSSIAGEMNSKGQTLWGLFSGVTHYTSHKMPAPKRDNARLESKYTGTGFDIDNKALTSILQLV